MKNELKMLFGNAPSFVLGKCGVPVRHHFMMKAIKLLAGEVDSISMLEIGSWIGYSTLTWKEAIGTFAKRQGSVLCVDPWLPYFTDDEIATGNEQYDIKNQAAASDLSYQMFLHNSSVTWPDVQLRHMRGKSAEILPYLKAGQFDLVYIDGNHHYQEVLADIQEAKRLVKENGIICGDDLELQYKDIDTRFAKDQKQMDFVKDPKSGRSYHPGVTLAVHEELGEVSNYAGFWLTRKTAEVYTNIRLPEEGLFVPGHFVDADRHWLQEWFRKVS